MVGFGRQSVITGQKTGLFAPPLIFNEGNLNNQVAVYSAAGRLTLLTSATMRHYS